MRNAALLLLFVLMPFVPCGTSSAETNPFPAGWREVKGEFPVPSFISETAAEAPRSGKVRLFRRGEASAYLVRLGDRPGAFRKVLSEALGGLDFDDSGRGMLKAVFTWRGEKGALALAYDGPSETSFLVVFAPEPLQLLDSLPAGRTTRLPSPKPWVYFLVLTAAVVLFAAYYKLRGYSAGENRR